MNDGGRLDWEDPAPDASSDPEWFLDLLEGTLSPAEERECRRLLRRDAGLQRRFDSYQAKVGLLEDLADADGGPAPSEAARQRILAAVAAEAGPRTRRRPLPWLALLASGSLAAAAALFFAVQLKESASRPENREVASDDFGTARKDGKAGKASGDRGQLDGVEGPVQTLEGARFERQRDDDQVQQVAKLEEAKTPAPGAAPMPQRPQDAPGREAAGEAIQAKRPAAERGDEERVADAAQPSSDPAKKESEPAAKALGKDGAELDTRQQEAGVELKNKGYADERTTGARGRAAAPPENEQQTRGKTDGYGALADGRFDQATVLVVEAGDGRRELEACFAGVRFAASQVKPEQMVTVLRAFTLQEKVPAETSRVGQSGLLLDADPSLTSEWIRLQGSRAGVGEALRQVMQRYKSQVQEVPRNLLAILPQPPEGAPTGGKREGVPVGVPVAKPAAPATAVPQPEAAASRDDLAKQRAASDARTDDVKRLLEQDKPAPGRALSRETTEEQREVWLLVKSRTAPAQPATTPKRE